MYRIPSARRRKGGDDRLDLIPILDAVFILIFFLLMSAQFVKIYEIGSDLPIMSDAPPPKDDKEIPLNLSLKINKKSVQVLTGENGDLQLMVQFDEDDEKYGLEELHNYLVDLKLKHKKENVVSFVPTQDVPYNALIKVMDQVRWHKDDEGNEGPLFNQIVFDNLVE